LNAIINALWEREITHVSEKYRWLLSLFIVVFIVTFSFQFTLMMHHMAFLGPGLGEEPSTDILNTLIFDRLSGPNAIYGWAFGIFLLAVILFRGWVMLWSYFGYQRSFGEKFPIHIVVLFMLVNTVGALSIPVVLFLVGMSLSALGYDFNDGWLLIQHTVIFAHNWVMANIPTLIEMPSPLAMATVFMLSGFVHYWLHRLGHESRFLWLLFHRHHHMAPNLFQFSTVAVFFAFPLFIVFVLPYAFIFATISKLFYAEPLYIEMFILNCFILIPEIFGHSDVFYEKVNRNRWVKWSSYVLGNGIYHYMHHSAENNDAHIIQGFNKGKNRHCNMVNIGGGFFFFWDRLFGTFAPLRDKKPKVGLTGSPTLHMNPIRLALSGIAQILYELKSNTGLKTSFKIIFGPSDYSPPNTKDYAIKV
jgi:sterol desaturase/sphingolipid hydroxylase (fatty acid hydroxylase superfamily)